MPLIPLAPLAREGMGTVAIVVVTRDSVGAVAGVVTAAVADVGANLAPASRPGGTESDSLCTLAFDSAGAVEGRLDKDNVVDTARVLVTVGEGVLLAVEVVAAVLLLVVVEAAVVVAVEVEVAVAVLWLVDVDAALLVAVLAVVLEELDGVDVVLLLMKVEAGVVPVAV